MGVTLTYITFANKKKDKKKAMSDANIWQSKQSFSFVYSDISQRRWLSYVPFSDSDLSFTLRQF